MTPERRQQLMREAADDLRGRWGDVQPNALQALADDLRAGIIENGAVSARDILSEVTHGPHSQSLFGSAEAGQAALPADRSANLERDTDLER